MSLVPSRLSCSGQRVSQWVKDVPEESNAEENQNRQWQYFAGYALLFASFFSTWWWTCLAFLGLLCTLFSMAWDCLYIMYTTTCYQAGCCLHEPRVEGCEFYLQQDHWIKQLFQSSSGSSPAPLSGRFIWQESPQSVAGKHDRLICEGSNLQMNLGVGNLLFLFLHLICWMLNRC